MQALNLVHPRDPHYPTTPALRERLARTGIISPTAPPQRQNEPPATPATTPAAARTFTDAERSLIRQVHGYMPAAQLLGILNARVTGDRGSTATLHTLEQLHAEMAAITATAAPGPISDWASLRKILARARAAGILALITEQLIDDFAVVFSLNAKQALSLKDIVLAAAQEDRT